MQNTGKIILLFVGWRITLLIAAYFAIRFFPVGSNNFLGGGLQNYNANPLLWGWANFDGNHYLAIAKNGYQPLTHAFFPLYPDLIKFFSFQTSADHMAFVGLIISNVCFLASLFFLWRLVKLDYPQRIAWYTLILLLIFPTSFFFGALYTESLFLLLSTASFWAARKRYWALAGILGAFASATRIYGILLLPAFIFEWYAERKKGENWKKDLVAIASICLVALGLLWYMLFLSKHTGNPFAFYTEQASFGQGRENGKIILLPQVFWRYLKMLFTVDMGLLYFTVVLEFLSSIFALLLLIFGYLYQMRPSYILYAFLGYILPTLTGNFVSLPRYLLVLFPFFIVFGIFLEKQARLIKILSFLISSFLLIFLVMLFIRGYWVA